MKKKKTKKEEYKIEEDKEQLEEIMLSIMKEQLDKNEKKEKSEEVQDDVLINRIHPLTKGKSQKTVVSNKMFKENLSKAVVILLLLLLLGVFIEGIYAVGSLLNYWASNENSNSSSRYDHEDTGFLQLHGFPSEPTLRGDPYAEYCEYSGDCYPVYYDYDPIYPIPDY